MPVSVNNEEIAIREVIDAWASAVRAKDIDGVLAHHTEDVLMFDVPPPVTVRGISAYRETWPPFFGALTEGMAAFDITELFITTDDRVAFATALLLEGRACERRQVSPATHHGAAQGRWLLENRSRTSLVSGGLIEVSRGLSGEWASATVPFSSSDRTRSRVA